MSVELPANGTAQGLRERKKERTRRTIRMEAFRLFREQGYSETTIEQIAAAADVSPSTFFRYFPTKEQLVLADDLDPLMIESLRRQPRDVSPFTALRNAVLEVFDSLPSADLAFEQERQALLYHVPELRSAIGWEIIRSIDLLAELLADHVGRPADDFEVRVAAGAMAGAALAMATVTPLNIENITRALDFLDAGMPLGRES
ncbi:TetR family transcriptional regulator [Nocardia amamiensis]|uniref:TetR family transcriptional regulator n=1 Tax=Nocardia amamiensis TaxID=404578 RepID=A0ABS0CR67_9NOCA|nr:TetR family transcriptional regulator [Nocardia amamiensis]MBF6298781.1 TetR family transcriptional regulator [Nocardia amamiensis]